jgi:hypothetical protein
MKRQTNLGKPLMLMLVATSLTACQSQSSSNPPEKVEMAPTMSELPPEFKGWQAESKAILKRVIDSKTLSSQDRQFIIDRLNGSILEEWSLVGPILMAYARSSADNSKDAHALYEEHVTEKHIAEAPEYFEVLRKQMASP